MPSVPPVLRGRFWAAHVLGLAALTAVILLGLWQLHVWQVSRQAATVDLTTQPPVPLDSVITGDSPFPGDKVGQPVRFTGRWEPAGTVYVSGRPRHGRPGYWAVTPVRRGHSAIPVVRGWTPTPRAAEPSGRVRVTGWLEPPDGAENLPDTNPADRVLPQLRIASLTQYVDTDLYGGYVIARTAAATRPSTKTAAPAAYLQPVRPPPAERVDWTTSLRNLLYAIQWWIFGGLVIYIWVRWCRDEIARRLPSTS